MVGEAKRRKDLQATLASQRGHRREVFERARRATVALGVMNPQDATQKPSVIGSGVVVKDEGLVVTAAHVLLDLESLVLKANRRNRSASIVAFVIGSAQTSFGVNEAGSQSQSLEFGYTLAGLLSYRLHPTADVGVARIRKDVTQLTSMVVNHKLAPCEPDEVATCGWPYGLELHAGQTILSSFLLGTVSAVVPHPAMGAQHRMHYLCQLPVNPGNSGGPVFDPDTGEVFGIVSSRYEPRGIPAGLAIVEPIYKTEAVVNELLAEMGSE